MDLNTKAKLRDSLIEVHRSLNFNVLVTIAFNKGEGSAASIECFVRTSFEKIDKTLLRNRYDPRSKKRVRGIFYPEKLTTNAHVHGLLCMHSLFWGSAKAQSKTINTINGILVPPRSSITIDIQDVSGAQGWDKFTKIKEQQHFGEYVTKEYYANVFLENWFFIN